MNGFLDLSLQSPLWNVVQADATFGEPVLSSRDRFSPPTMGNWQQRRVQWDSGCWEYLRHANDGALRDEVLEPSFHHPHRQQGKEQKMAGYLIANYRLTNPDAYRDYPPAVLPTLAAHGAEVLVADYASVPVEGDPSAVTIVIRFPSKAAARAWYDSPEYRKIVGLRTDNSEGMVLFADEFVMPK